MLAKCWVVLVCFNLVWVITSPSAIDNLHTEFIDVVILFLKTFALIAKLEVLYYDICFISKVENMNNNNLGIPGNQK